MSHILPTSAFHNAPLLRGGILKRALVSDIPWIEIHDRQELGGILFETLVVIKMETVVRKDLFGLVKPERLTQPFRNQLFSVDSVLFLALAFPLLVGRSDL